MKVNKTERKNRIISSRLHLPGVPVTVIYASIMKCIAYNILYIKLCMPYFGSTSIPHVHMFLMLFLISLVWQKQKMSKNLNKIQIII